MKQVILFLSRPKNTTEKPRWGSYLLSAPIVRAFEIGLVSLVVLILSCRNTHAAVVADEVFRFMRADAIVAAGPEGSEFEVTDWNIDTRHPSGFGPFSASIAVHSEATALDGSGSGTADAFVDMASSFTFEPTRTEFAFSGSLGSAWDLVGDARRSGPANGAPRGTFGFTNNWFIFTIDKEYNYLISGLGSGSGLHLINVTTNENISHLTNSLRECWLLGNTNFSSS